MSRPKHTPGPWRLQEQFRTVFTTSAPGGKAGVTNAIATAHTAQTARGSAVDPDEARANAHLIAAAPELLAALEEITDTLLEHQAAEDAALKTRARIAIDQAAQAIARAKGEEVKRG